MQKKFFFNDTATTEIYTLSLHDALPISHAERAALAERDRGGQARLDEELQPAAADAHRLAGELRGRPRLCRPARDRKSTRLNSSHANISYAVFCLKKKTGNHCQITRFVT